jgi:hypothetical protein
LAPEWWLPASNFWTVDRDSHANESIANDDDFGIHQTSLEAAPLSLGRGREIASVTPLRRPSSTGIPVTSGIFRANVNFISHALRYAAPQKIAIWGVYLTTESLRPCNLARATHKKTDNAIDAP